MKTLKFVVHLFFEDRRIPLGVGLGMVVAYFIHSRLPAAFGDAVYLAVIMATLALSIIKNA